MSIVDEIWRDIADFEGLYQVSNLGNVRSLDRVITHSNGRKLLIKGKLLKAGTTQNGYKIVTLCNESQHTKTIHTLVAKAFIGERPKLFDVNHIDGNKSNNNADNLEYCSKSDNIRHAIASGLIKSKKGRKGTNSLKGQANGRSVLTEADVKRIKSLLKHGVKESVIVLDYKVTKTTIFDIKSGKSWSHVTI